MAKAAVPIERQPTPPPGFKRDRCSGGFDVVTWAKDLCLKCRVTNTG